MEQVEKGKYEMTVKDYTNGEEVGKLIMRFVNAYGFDKAGFVEAVKYSHRTLQQSLFGLMLEVIKEWDKMGKEGNFDPRNEYTVHKSAEIVKVVDGFTTVPCI